jgi:hypothetical protein
MVLIRLQNTFSMKRHLNFELCKLNSPDRPQRCHQCSLLAEKQ